MNVAKYVGLVACWVVVLAEAACAADEVGKVSAFFRAGQTFVTWEQPAVENARYAIFRNGKQIAIVHDHTSLNLMASIDRLALSNTNPPAEYEIPKRVYFIIKEGESPLDARTGLFVYTAKANEDAEYAVGLVTGSNESVKGGDTVRVAERVEFPSPVRQNELDFVHWTDDVGTEFYPAMSSVPSVPYNFRLRAPQGAGPHPLIGFLHGQFLQFSSAGMGGQADSVTVRIAFDSPVMRGRIKGLTNESWPNGAWYGYNENFGTGRPLAEGKMVDYVVRRVLWTLSWAERAYPIDADRVSLQGGSMGGIGALSIGLLHPDRFAAIHAFIPPLRSGAQGGRESSMMPIAPARYVVENANRNLPYIMYTAGRTDQIVGWPDKLEFANALRQAKLGFTFYWDLRGHDQNYTGSVPSTLDEPPVPWGRTAKRPQMSVVTFSRRQSFPAFSAVSVDSDPGTVNFATRPPSARPPLDSPGAGDLIGTYNGAVQWDRSSIVDKSDRWEIALSLMAFVEADRATATITPRRLQQFRVEPGRTYHYQISGGADQSGMVTADAAGLITIENIPITKSGVRLIIASAPIQ